MLAGQSFYGKETADDVVKTVILYVVGVISWMFWKAPSTPATQNNLIPVNQNNPVAASPNNPTLDLDLNQDEPSSSTSSLQEENGIKLRKIILVENWRREVHLYLSDDNLKHFIVKLVSRDNLVCNF